MRLRSADWRFLAFWVAGFVLAGFFLTWVIPAEYAHELRRGAQHTGVRWAQLASLTVPLVPLLILSQLVIEAIFIAALGLLLLRGLFRPDVRAYLSEV